MTRHQRHDIIIIIVLMIISSLMKQQKIKTSIKIFNPKVQLTRNIFSKINLNQMFDEKKKLKFKTISFDGVFFILSMNRFIYLYLKKQCCHYFNKINI